MVNYLINEAEFEVPDDWDDRSANIFAIGNKLPLPLSFVITRDSLSKEVELATYADEKLGELESQLNQFKILEKKAPKS